MYVNYWDECMHICIQIMSCTCICVVCILYKCTKVKGLILWSMAWVRSCDMHVYSVHLIYAMYFPSCMHNPIAVHFFKLFPNNFCILLSHSLLVRTGRPHRSMHYFGLWKKGRLRLELPYTRDPWHSAADRWSEQHQNLWLVESVPSVRSYILSSIRDFPAWKNTVI